MLRGLEEGKEKREKGNGEASWAGLGWAWLGWLGGKVGWLG